VRSGATRRVAIRFGSSSCSPTASSARADGRAVDPRRTDTAGDVDLFLGLKPGTEPRWFSGLAVAPVRHGALDRDYVARHTSGFDDALARSRGIARQHRATALATGLSSRMSPASPDVWRYAAVGHAVFAASPFGAGQTTRSMPSSLPSATGRIRQAILVARSR